MEEKEPEIKSGNIWTTSMPIALHAFPSILQVQPRLQETNLESGIHFGIAIVAPDSEDDRVAVGDAYVLVRVV